MKTAKCKDCGDRKMVYRDTGLCDDCEADYVYCTVCEKSHHKKRVCRHVFWDAMDGWWAGPGADDPCYSQIERSKDGVLFFLTHLDATNTGHKALADLFAALKTGTLTLWLSGPMIGALSMNMEGRDENGDHIYWPNIIGDATHESYGWGDDQSELFTTGGNWIMSLDTKTPRENAVVLQWITEVLKEGAVRA
jgi:hypothetical protein